MSFHLKKPSQMPKKKYIVTLTDKEQAALEELVNKGKNPAYKVNQLCNSCIQTDRALPLSIIKLERR